MSAIVLKTLWMYGLAAVVSMLIAAIIKAIVLLLGRYGRSVEPAATRQPIAVTATSASDAPAEHVAVIGAAVFAALGEHRVVYIEAEPRGDWAADGRHAHHTSHVLPGHPPRR